MIDTLLLGGVALALLGCGLCSSSHTALSSYSTARLELAWKRDRKRLDQYLEAVDEMLLAAVSLGVVCHVAMLVLFLLFFSRWLNSNYTAIVLWSLLASTLLAVVPGEALPRSLARRVPERVAAIVLPLMYRVRLLTLPVWIVADGFTRAFAKDFGANDDKDSPEDAAEDIMLAMEDGEKEGVIEEEEKEMIRNILEIGDVDASQVMVPRTDMICIQATDSIEESRIVASHTGHSRMPVYEGSTDNIVGVLYAKDLLVAGSDGSVSIQSLMRKPYLVPETKKIGDLLHEFRVNKVHIAIVLDEYGGTAGMVTIEDILEEIVGEIEDEHDKSEQILRNLGGGIADVDARIPVRELNEALDLEIPEEESYDTLGGFVFAQFGKVPKQGESFDWEGVGFSVLDADERRVHRIKVVASGWDKQ
ncbi:hemolysin family protein [Planctomycetota bacterium]